MRAFEAHFGHGWRAPRIIRLIVGGKIDEVNPKSPPPPAAQLGCYYTEQDRGLIKNAFFQQSG